MTPPSFLDQLKRQGKGATEKNPAQVPLPQPDLAHFGLVGRDGVQPEAVLQLVKLVCDFRHRLPVFGALHELVGRGYGLEEAAAFIYAQSDFFFDPKRSRTDTEGFRFYEAIRPPEWDMDRPDRETIETYIERVSRWIRRDSSDRCPMHSTLDAHWLGLVDRNGRVNVDRVRAVRDFILAHPDKLPDFRVLAVEFGVVDSPKAASSDMPALKGKALQKLKKLKRKKGALKRRR